MSVDLAADLDDEQEEDLISALFERKVAAGEVVIRWVLPGWGPGLGPLFAVLNLLATCAWMEKGKHRAAAHIRHAL